MRNGLFLKVVEFISIIYFFIWFLYVPGHFAFFSSEDLIMYKSSASHQVDKFG